MVRIRSTWKKFYPLAPEGQEMFHMEQSASQDAPPQVMFHVKHPRVADDELRMARTCVPRGTTSKSLLPGVGECSTWNNPPP
jgi:hypothetical protein